MKIAGSWWAWAVNLYFLCMCPARARRASLYHIEVDGEKYAALCSICRGIESGAYRARVESAYESAHWSIAERVAEGRKFHIPPPSADVISAAAALALACCPLCVVSDSGARLHRAHWSSHLIICISAAAALFNLLLTIRVASS